MRRLKLDRGNCGCVLGRGITSRNRRLYTYTYSVYRYYREWVIYCTCGANKTVLLVCFICVQQLILLLDIYVCVLCSQMTRWHKKKTSWVMGLFNWGNISSYRISTSNVYTRNVYRRDRNDNHYYLCLSVRKTHFHQHNRTNFTSPFSITPHIYIYI